MVGGVEWSGVTGCLCRTRIHRVVLCVSHAAGEEGERKFPGAGEPCFFFSLSVCACVTWHGMTRHTHTGLACPKTGIEVFFFGARAAGFVVPGHTP